MWSKYCTDKGCAFLCVDFLEGVSYNNWQFNYKLISSNDQYALNIYQLSIKYNITVYNEMTGPNELVPQIANFITLQQVITNRAKQVFSVKFWVVICSCHYSICFWIWFNLAQLFFYSFQKNYKCF